MHMNSKIVEKIPFFQEKDHFFIAALVPLLKSMRLKSGEILYREGEYAEEVYFLVKGRVNLKASNGVVFKTYIEVSYFGEMDILEERAAGFP